MNITRHAIEQKGFFEDVNLSTLLLIGLMLSIIIICLTILIAFEIHSTYQTDIFRSIISGLILSSIFASIMTMILIFIINKSVDDYEKKMNEIEITGQTKIENVTVNEKQNVIATYQYKDKSQFIEFMTNESVNIKEGDTVRFDYYKEKIEKDSSTVTVSKKDIKDGKIKIQHK